MPLTARQVEKLKPQEKAYKVTDAGGLFLHVTIKGNKSWRLKYRFDGKEKLMTFGLCPSVSLAEARGKRDKSRELLSMGIDPSDDKKARRAESLISANNTFMAVAREWHAGKINTWFEKYCQCQLKSDPPCRSKTDPPASVLVGLCRRHGRREKYLQCPQELQRADT